jgi:hypothetical protein
MKRWNGSNKRLSRKRRTIGQKQRPRISGCKAHDKKYRDHADKEGSKAPSAWIDEICYPTHHCAWIADGDEKSE